MSSERSGSNLLRAMLDMHEQISAPPAMQLFNKFREILPFYGNLPDSKNTTKLRNDVLDVVNVKNTKNEWKEEIESSDIDINNKTPFSSLVCEVYKAYAQKENNNYFVCKEIGLFEYAFQILYNRPNSKFIYLVRDGRDVAASEKSIDIRKRHIFLLAERWLKEQNKALNVFQNLDRDRIIIVKYEDLLKDTETTLRKVCDFIGVEYSNQLLKFYNKREIKDQSKKSEFWKNISSPVDSNKIGKYKLELSQKEIKIFDSVCCDYLKILEYSVDSNSFKVGVLKEFKYRIHNKIFKFVNRTNQKSIESKGKIVEVLNKIKSRRKKEEVKLV